MNTNLKSNVNKNTAYFYMDEDGKISFDFRDFHFETETIRAYGEFLRVAYYYKEGKTLVVKTESGTIYFGLMDLITKVGISPEKVEEILKDCDRVVYRDKWSVTSSDFSNLCVIRIENNYLFAVSGERDDETLYVYNMKDPLIHATFDYKESTQKFYLREDSISDEVKKLKLQYYVAQYANELRADVGIAKEYMRKSAVKNFLETEEKK